GRLEQVRPAPSEPGCGRQAVQARGAPAAADRLLGPLRRRLVRLQPFDRGDHAPTVLAAFLLLALQVLEQTGLDDDPAHLGRDRPEDPQLVTRESPTAER